MRRELMAAAVLVTVTLAMLVASLHQINEVLRPRSAWEQKMLRADPVLYYEVGQGLDPVFRLSGTERVVRFVTHARTATSGEPYDPRRVHDYGLRFDLLDRSGAVLWSREIHTRTRQSKSEPTPQGWLRENAFAPDPDAEIWDDRLLYLTLPTTVPINAQLRVSGVEGSEALLRAYARRERTPFQQEVFMLRRAALDPHAGDSMKVGALRFDQLTTEERTRVASIAWERMAAEGELGRDYSTASVYYDGFRLPFDQAGPPAGFIVGPSEPAVVNVVGPGRIWVAVQDPRSDPELATLPTAEHLMVSARAAMGSIQLGQLEIRETGATAQFELASGVHSVVLEAVGPGPVRVQVNAERPLPEAPTGSGAASTARPDIQRIVHFGAGAAEIPIDIDIEPSVDALDRLLRITLRSALEPGAELATASIELATFDQRGHELTRTTSAVASPLARFERLVLADGTRRPVTEPSNMRVVVPEAAKVLRIYPASNAYVRVATYDREAEPQIAPPYDTWQASGWKWRYAPRLLDRWLPVFPSNARELAAAQQRVAVDAQTRLETERGEDPEAAADSRRSAVSIEPLGRPLQHLIMAKVEPDEHDAVLDEWGPGTFTNITKSRSTTLDFERGPPRSPRIDWEVRGSAATALGQTLEVIVDGERLVSRTVGATRGSISLRGLSKAVHSIEIRTEASLRVWIDRPPARGQRASLARLRTVYAMGSRGLQVPVVTEPGVRKVLNVLLYAPGIEEDPDVMIRSELDAGAPDRTVGATISAFTPAVREFSLPAAKETTRAMFSDVRGASPGYARVVSIPIGSDVAPGRHIVRVSANRRVWARLFIYDQAPARDGSWVRSTMRSDP